MTKITHQLFIFAIATILLTGTISANPTAFADNDDDDKKKKNKVLTGDGPPPKKLGKTGDLYIDNESDNFDIYEKTGKKTWELTGTMKGPAGPQGIQGEPGAKGDKGDPGPPGELGDIQGEIDAKIAQIDTIESQISANNFDVISLQMQLGDLALPDRDVLTCQRNCLVQEAVTDRALLICILDTRGTGLDPVIECAAQQAAVDNFSCICDRTSDPVLAASLEEQITALEIEIVALNAQLEKCQFELMVLETLQNHFG